MKWSFTIISIFAWTFSITSCNQSNEFNVGVIFPEAKNGGALINIVVSYGLNDYGIPIKAEQALSIIDKIQKYVYGGTGCQGVVEVTDNSVTFTPAFGSSLVVQGVHEFKIPISDITNVRVEPYMVVAKAVIVSTKNGDISFLGPQKHSYIPWSYASDELYKLIKDKL